MPHSYGIEAQLRATRIRYAIRAKFVGSPAYNRWSCVCAVLAAMSAVQTVVGMFLCVGAAFLLALSMGIQQFALSCPEGGPQLLPAVL